ncbi:MAG: S1 RNA-binding domain-containing protein [Erysipelotrichia bacterium]|nr:S1 RNA-binding domain-containing protein [Erysipelotrichia bacterium]
MYRVGQVVQGIITGIKSYGAFVKVDDDVSGLIHISEISDYFVNDVHRYFRKGEKVVVKIIDIDQSGQLRLSLKAIQSNRKYAIPTKKNIYDLTNIGFKSLEKQLPIWIEEALKEK